MVPLYRFSEIAVHCLFGSLPLLLLSLYPFQNQLRFSRRATGVAVALITLLQLVLGFAFSVWDASSHLLTLLYCAAFIPGTFLLVKAHFCKTLFTVLAFSSIANLLSVISGGLDHLLFGPIPQDTYRWSRYLCIAAVQIITTVPLFFYIRATFTAAVNIQSKFWDFLWAIPATFHLIWYYHLHLTGQNRLQVDLDPESTGFLLVIHMGAAVIYHTAVLLLLEQDKAQKLAHTNHQLSMHKLQHENLQLRINEARQAKHDVRHHTLLIMEYLRSGKLQELEAYLEHYTETLPSTQSLIHCQHYAANALLGYYAQQAQNSGIQMDIFVQLPEVVNLPETTLSVVLGNLLENAMDACRQISEGKKNITVRGKAEAGTVFFEVKNTFHGNLRRDKSGRFLSTKAANRGVGLESVAQLASSHGGMFEVDSQDGIFRVSVLLLEEAEPKRSK